MHNFSILVLVAGTNKPSNSDALADAFIQGIHQLHGTHVDKLRLDALTIEHFRVDFYDKPCTQEEDFCRVQHLIEEASGVVIASPIWNFSVPAHLKNLIDRMGSFALDETRSKGTLKGKPFYFIFTGGSPNIAWATLMKKTISHMPESIRYFGGSPIGMHFEPKATKGRGKFGLVVDERPESLASVRKQGYDFATICKEYKKTGKAPVKQRTMSALYRLGGSLIKKIS